MNKRVFPLTLDTSEYADLIAPELKEHLLKVLYIIDSLYALQTQGESLHDTEKISYKNIIAHLHKCSDFLPAAYATNLKGQVKKIENGIYDLAVLEIKVSDKITIFLVFGKIISARDSKGYYSAVLGVEDTGYYGLIDEFKRRISSCHSKVSLIEISDIDHITGLSNTFRCINVISMAGFVNDGYLPFSLFYSGGKQQMLSSLSNTILLTNIYTHRFTAISEKIGKELIDPVCYKDINNSDLTYKILVLWLWGHDMGHFLKEDKLKTGINDENAYQYEVLHELRSDVFALYLLKQLLGDIIDIEKEYIFQTYVLEMLRYMQRGDFHCLPDSASAYIIFKFMLSNTSSYIDKNSNRMFLKYSEFGKMIDRLLIVALDLFRKGSFDSVFEFLTFLEIDRNFIDIEPYLDFRILNGDTPQNIKII